MEEREELAVQAPEDEPTPAEYQAQAGGFFRTLGALVYTELTQGEIDNLAAMNLLAARKGLPEGDMSDGFARMGRYLARRGANARQDLAVEYARIFLGAGVDEKDCAVPFESVFTSKDGLLMQESRDEVVAFYRRHGMEVEPSLNVPEDHLGFELQFMGILCEQTAAAYEAGDEDGARELEAEQVRFLDQHILNWVDALARKVEKCALSPFYPGVMKVIRAFAVEHREYLTA